MSRVTHFGFAALGLAAFLILLVMSLPDALAADGTTAVTVPIGDWIGASAGAVASVALGIGLWMLRQLPAHWRALALMTRAEQMLEKAITYGINSVKTATKHQKLKVDVGHEVAAKALQYVIDKAPAVLVEWMGGAESILDMIWARLELDESATELVFGEKDRLIAELPPHLKVKLA